MRTPADLASWAEKKYRAGHRTWLAGRAADTSPAGPLGSFPTQPPTEADVAADPRAAASWIRSWTAFERSLPAGVSLQWVLRRWSGFGDQRLPLRVRVETATAMADLAGHSTGWRELCDRAELLVTAWPGQPAVPAALPGLAGDLGRLGPADLPRLVAVTNWLIGHPESGLLARQVPVEGVDTKWLERHRRIVGRLVAALTGHSGLGLRVEPRRFRVRAFLDGPLADFTAAAADLADLSWTPAGVLLVENQESMIPLEDLPGVVAVHSQGLAAPELAVVPWIADSRLLYWGDLDTHGLRILSLVRQVLPQAESILMDPATLDRFRTLAVAEPSPYRRAVSHLTPAESAVLAALREHDLRLEQERIEWGHAVTAIRTRLAGWARSGEPSTQTQASVEALSGRHASR